MSSLKHETVQLYRCLWLCDSVWLSEGLTSGTSSQTEPQRTDLSALGLGVAPPAARDPTPKMTVYPDPTHPGVHTDSFEVHTCTCLSRRVFTCTEYTGFLICEFFSQRMHVCGYTTFFYILQWCFLVSFMILHRYQGSCQSSCLYQWSNDFKKCSLHSEIISSKCRFICRIEFRNG